MEKIKAFEKVGNVKAKVSLSATTVEQGIREKKRKFSLWKACAGTPATEHICLCPPGATYPELVYIAAGHTGILCAHAPSIHAYNIQVCNINLIFFLKKSYCHVTR